MRRGIGVALEHMNKRREEKAKEEVRRQEAESQKNMQESVDSYNQSQAEKIERQRKNALLSGGLSEENKEREARRRRHGIGSEIGSNSVLG